MTFQSNAEIYALLNDPRVIAKGKQLEEACKSAIERTEERDTTKIKNSLTDAKVGIKKLITSNP